MNEDKKQETPVGETGEAKEETPERKAEEAVPSGEAKKEEKKEKKSGKKPFAFFVKSEGALLLSKAKFFVSVYFAPPPGKLSPKP